jgi:hypothetical protein
MREEQNACTFIAGLVRQLAKPEHTQSQQVQTIVQQCMKAERKLSLNELADLLHLVAETYTAAFIVVEALDECRSAELPQLTSCLQHLQACLPAVRVMVTARPQLALGEEFKDAVRFDICAHEVDIRQYVNCQISRLSKQVVRTAGLQEVVTQGIIDAANGM